MLIFVFSVAKVEVSDGSKSSTSGRNKKPVTKKVMEYCYEPEMEEVTATCIVLRIFTFCYLIQILNAC